MNVCPMQTTHNQTWTLWIEGSILTQVCPVRCCDSSARNLWMRFDSPKSVWQADKNPWLWIWFLWITSLLPKSLWIPWKSVATESCWNTGRWCSLQSARYIKFVRTHWIHSEFTNICVGWRKCVSVVAYKRSLAISFLMVPVWHPWKLVLLYLLTFNG